MLYHPHAVEADLLDESDESYKNAIIYVARDKLSWDRSRPGAGRFKFNDHLILTKSGLTPSKWNLPDFFKEAKISYHTDNSWRDGYFQSTGRGQEFVIRDNKKVDKWAKDIIKRSQIDL